MAAEPKAIRFGASWSTQYRFTQAIGRGLGALMPIKATVVIGGRGDSGLENDEVDLIFSKGLVNKHRYEGKGYFAGDEPAPWLRTIAWLPQEDRFLFAMAPWTGIESFEDFAAKKPKLNIVAMTNATAPVLKEYGFSFEDIKAWGGTIRTMEHTARDAKAHLERGELDAFIGDGSAYDFSAWTFVASRGFKFLDIRPDVMDRLETNWGLQRIITPVGFLPGIDHNLITLDDSHIVATCHERLDDELAYNLARSIDENKRDIELCSIQMDYGQRGALPITEPTYWTSLTGQIDRQWDQKIVGAPLHPGAERYYREKGLL